MTVKFYSASPIALRATDRAPENAAAVKSA